MHLAAIYFNEASFLGENMLLQFGGRNEYSIQEGKVSFSKNSAFLDDFYSSSPLEMISAIAGKNGSGKTTLLKEIASVLSMPDNPYSRDNNFTAFFEDNEVLYFRGNSNFIEHLSIFTPLPENTDTIYYSLHADFYSNIKGIDVSLDKWLLDDLENYNQYLFEYSGKNVFRYLFNQSIKRQIEFLASSSSRIISEESGSYEFTLENVAGCDSLVTLDLTINEAYDITETITACESYFWESSGETLTTSDTYQVAFQTFDGCDSLHTLELTISEHSVSEIEAFACDEYESPCGQFTFTESGMYNDTILNAAGCDSIILIELDIAYSSSASESISACFSYISNAGEEYFSSGEYTETFTNTQGCDSTFTLDLTIHQVDVTVENTENTFTVSEDDAQYQWLDCNNDFSPIDLATNQSFSPVENGSYAIEVTTEFCTDTSQCVTIINVSVLNNTFDQDISLYPNPTLGQIYLNISRDIQNANVRVYSITGQLLDQFNGNLYAEMNLPLRPELSGLLLIVIEANGMVATFRITKLN